jgi:protein TonB
LEPAGSDAGRLHVFPVLQREGFTPLEDTAPLLNAEIAEDIPADIDALAREHLAPEIPLRRNRPWVWALTVIIHLLIVLALLFLVRIKLPPEPRNPPSIDLVFAPEPDQQQSVTGSTQVTQAGAPQPTAPQNALHAPPSPATAPPPPGSAPPPSEPEVNLNMPPMPFADTPSAPTPPQPQPHPPTRPIRHPTQTPKYTMMQGMSLGNGAGEAPPAPPEPQAQPGMNLSLPESDTQAVNAPDVVVKGDIGDDWKAELDRWVNTHKYYPQAAIEQNQQGNVAIEFTVDRQGNVSALKLLGSSGSPFLDQAWLGLFQQSQLPPFPPGTKANTVTVDATMHFELIN